MFKEILFAKLVYFFSINTETWPILTASVSSILTRIMQGNKNFQIQSASIPILLEDLTKSFHFKSLQTFPVNYNFLTSVDIFLLNEVVNDCYTMKKKQVKISLGSYDCRTQVL